MAGSFGHDLGVSIIGALVGAAALGALGVVYGQSLADGGEYLNPSCDHAVGLTPVPLADLTASGPQVQSRYGPERAIDGYTGSAWIPPLESKAEKEQSHVSKFVPVFHHEVEQSTLTLTLAGEQDVRLVCVNNGLGSGQVRYENFGKVKTVRVWKDAEEEKAKTAILVSMPTSSSDRSQEVADTLGPSTSIHLQLVDAYSGADVVSHDPNHCSSVTDERDYASVGGNQELFERGCIVGATPQAGLSEITLYVRDPSDPVPLPWRLWPGN